MELNDGLRETVTVVLDCCIDDLVPNLWKVLGPNLVYSMLPNLGSNLGG